MRVFAATNDISASTRSTKARPQFEDLAEQHQYGDHRRGLASEDGGERPGASADLQHDIGRLDPRGLHEDVDQIQVN